MRTIYSLILYLLTPLVLLRLAWRGLRAPLYWRRWGERFGHYPQPACPGCIWLHAVSVGEAQAAAPLVQALRQAYPTIPLLITSTTPTGSAQVKRLFGDSVTQVYVPYDLPGAVARFMRFAQPRLALIMETELWPNLYRACAELRTPLIIANARLSPRSFAGYQRLAALVRSTMRDVSIIAAQSQADAERFRTLAASTPVRIEVTGSIKFDMQLPASLREEAEVLRRDLGADRPIWIAASTHEGEDQQVLDAFDEIRAGNARALLLLVPRHPERFERVRALCERRGHAVVTRSSQLPCPAETGVFLGDSMGELMLFYAAADVAFVGGSLVPTGGHNPLEPAALGVPVLFGPHTFNFDGISRLLIERGAAQRIEDSHTLASAVGALLISAERRLDIGERGQRVVDENRGALGRLMDLVTTTMQAKA